ncbi:Fanconi anaemia protein FancD2 nuclease-domain-containing protein [Gorgonomyces haynaldii]|nr:Fanconi anaemia protein FancD2 nuclease-domain-containing protein [Gorgonomyces haynaldii]
MEQLVKCGVLKTASGFELEQEPSQCSHDLNALLGKDPKLSNKLVSELFSNAALKDLLHPLPNVNPPTSLLKILLNVDLLQEELLNQMLFEALETQDEINSNFSKSTPILVLNHLRQMDHIQNPGKFTQSLLEFLGTGSPQLQAEIIRILPEVTIDSQQKQVASALLERLEDPQLCISVLDTLTSFSLDEHMMSEARDTALQMIQKVNVSSLPVLVRFILGFANPDNAKEIIYSVRKHVDMTLLSKRIKQEESKGKGKGDAVGYEALVLDSFKQVFRQHDFLADAWLKTISDLRGSQFKTLDLLLLFVFSAMKRSKKVHQIFVHQVTHRVITSQMLQATIDLHIRGILLFERSIIQLAEALLCHGSESCIKASKQIYVSLFQRVSYADQQDVIDSLLTCIGSRVSFQTEAALQVLKEMTIQDYQGVEKFNVFIKSVLDYMEILELGHVQMLYTILSILAVKPWYASKQSETASFSEIHMLIQKQLSNADERYQSYGVLGAVELIAQLAHKDFKSPKFTKMAQSIFQAMHKSCEKVAVLLRLAYDEMARHVSTGTLDPAFVEWLSCEIDNPFLNNFVIDEEELEGFNTVLGTFEFENPGVLTILKNWTQTPDVTSTIAIYLNVLRAFPNVWTHVHAQLPFPEPPKEQPELIVTLCSHARLFKCCKSVTEPEDPLIELRDSGVLLFDKPDGEIAKVFTERGRTAIAISLHFAIHWNREILNLFTAEPGEDNLRACLKRLEHIQRLNQELDEFSKTIPLWKPDQPFATCAEDAVQSKVTVALSSFPDTSCDQQTSNALKMSKAKNTLQSPLLVASLDSYKRELDMDVFALFSLLPKDRECATYFEWHYLLEDLRSKIKDRFVEKRKANEKLKSMTQLDIVSKLTQYLPGIFQLLEYIAKDILDTKTDDGFVLSNKDKPMTDSFFYILDICSMVLGWQHHQEQDEILAIQNVVQCMGSKGSGPNTDGALLYVLQFEETLWSTEAAYYFAKLCITLNQLGLNDTSQPAIGALLDRFVNKEWPDRCQPKTMEYLLDHYITFCPNPLETLETILKEAFPALVQRNEDVLSHFPMLNHESFIIFYKVVCHKTASLCVHISEVDEDRLDWIEKLSVCFHQTVVTVKQYDRPEVIVMCLKNCKLFIQNYIKHVLPVLGALFKENQKRIVDTLRTVQMGTRIVQAICNEYKVTKKDSISALIPQLRKMLETFVVEVKKMISQNNCLQAFTIANLKHRSLSGDEIGSQLVVHRSSEDEEQPVLPAIAEEEEEEEDRRREESVDLQDIGENENQDVSVDEIQDSTVEEVQDISIDSIAETVDPLQDETMDGLQMDSEEDLFSDDEPKKPVKQYKRKKQESKRSKPQKTKKPKKTKKSASRFVDDEVSEDEEEDDGSIGSLREFVDGDLDDLLDSDGSEPKRKRSQEVFVLDSSDDESQQLLEMLQEDENRNQNTSQEQNSPLTVRKVAVEKPKKTIASFAQKPRRIGLSRTKTQLASQVSFRDPSQDIGRHVVQDSD